MVAPLAFALVGWLHLTAKYADNHSFILFSPELGRRRRNNWDKSSLIGGTKAACASKVNKELFTASSHQVDRHWLESSASACRAVTWEENTGTINMPASVSLPWASVAGHNVIWHRISIWSAGVSYPSCVPTLPLAHPHPTCWGHRVGKKKVPWLCVCTVQQ